MTDLDSRLREGLSLGETGPLSDRSQSVMRDYIRRAGPDVTVDSVQEHFPFLEENERVNRWIARTIESIYADQEESR